MRLSNSSSCRRVHLQRHVHFTDHSLPQVNALQQLERRRGLCAESLVGARMLYRREPGQYHLACHSQMWIYARAELCWRTCTQASVLSLCHNHAWWLPLSPTKPGWCCADPMAACERCKTGSTYGARECTLFARQAARPLDRFISCNGMPPTGNRRQDRRCQDGQGFAPHVLASARVLRREPDTEVFPVTPCDTRTARTLTVGRGICKVMLVSVSTACHAHMRMRAHVSTPHAHIQLIVGRIICAPMPGPPRVQRTRGPTQC